MRIFEVGGCIRDELMGLPTKDVDFAVEAESFDAMREYLIDSGFKIFVETPKFLTIRATPPKDSPLRERTSGADFVLCRKDSPGGDGRRPDYVEVGTVFDDLARRDFTVNAIARDIETGELIDPFDGVRDIKNRYLRFVGNPYTRIEEDGLRVARGFRFEITKGFDPVHTTDKALRSVRGAEMLSLVSKERIREELEKMFRHDTLASLSLITFLPSYTIRALFPDGLRLSATMKS